MTNSAEVLYLVDGMSQIFRAYYAIRGLSTASGLATNAVYGFTMMLRKLIATEKPHYLAMVLDSAEPTFRHEAYADYKATRGLMPDDLALQIPYILQVCEAFRIPVVRLSRFEADDLIGTLACKAEAVGLETVIVTQDKDLCQLVTDRVTIMREERNAAPTRLDRAGVEAKMGVPPEQVVELLGLQGDSSDNIPGAPGIGEKGALQLLKEFGTIEAALAGWEQVSRKTYRESLRDNADIIRQSRELARIKVDCDIELDLDALRLEEPDAAAAHRLFTELEFTTLAREFASAAAPVAVASVPRPVEQRAYRVIDRAADAERLAESLFSTGRFAFACAVSPAGALGGVAVATGPGTAAYVDLEGADRPREALAALADVLGNGLVDKTVHDAKAALHALNRGLEAADPRRAARVVAAVQKCGTPFPWDGGIRVEPVSDDTMLAAYLLDPNRAKYMIGDLAREVLGVELEAELDGFASAAARALQEADAALRLADVLRGQIDAKGLSEVYTTMELPLVEVLYEMERLGLLVDTAALADIGAMIDRETSRLAVQIYELAGSEFNINSPAQLGEIFERLNYPMKKRTATGKLSTNKDVLDVLAVDYELPRLIIEYRELTKLKGTYVDAIPALIDPATGRVHTSLNQTVAATGRLSSTTPNLQNIPVRTETGRAIRRAFIAAPGCLLISADYSQIELRILAHVARDEKMAEAFRTGEDIHAATARALFGATSASEEKDKRRLAKIVNFAIAYSVGPFGLAQRTGLSRKAAKDAIENYYETYSGVHAYMEATPLVARENGEVRTLHGRLRQIPDIDNKNHNLRAAAEREAINMPIQGTAADLMKLAMVRVRGALERAQLRGRVVMQVHDELLVEVPAAEVEPTCDLLKREMEAVFPLDVPLVVDVGSGVNWMEAK